MVKPRFRIAELDQEGITKVRQMEEAMGGTVVAVEALYPAANLKSDQIQRLQELEKELDVVLVAYRKG